MITVKLLRSRGWANTQRQETSRKSVTLLYWGGLTTLHSAPRVGAGLSLPHWCPSPCQGLFQGCLWVMAIEKEAVSRGCQQWMRTSAGIDGGLLTPTQYLQVSDVVRDSLLLLYPMPWVLTSGQGHTPYPLLAFNSIISPLWSPVQNENVEPLFWKLLRISRWP